MAGPIPEERVSRPALCQRWQSLTFLHWRYPPEEIQRLLPPGLVVDTFDGAAWLGLTPFLLVRMRPLCLPPVPRLSTFPETNLRTYVRDEAGTDGLWFFSLDVSSLATVLGARSFFWVPYHWATMSVEEAGFVRYRSRRRGLSGPSPGHQITVRPATPVLPESHPPLVDFLTGRWRAFTRIAGRLAVVPVEHQPWPLYDAEVDELDEDVVAAAGLTPSEAAPFTHFSPGVDVRLGFPRPSR
ncbi:MAG: DUF2071 domain-containing protein [Actinomycetota bacterium]|nr:DUF2071 domain-containing protein [Actinomycetota bacterium]